MDGAVRGDDGVIGEVAAQVPALDDDRGAGVGGPCGGVGDGFLERGGLGRLREHGELLEVGRDYGGTCAQLAHGGLRVAVEEAVAARGHHDGVEDHGHVRELGEKA